LPTSCTGKEGMPDFRG